MCIFDLLLVYLPGGLLEGFCMFGLALKAARYMRKNNSVHCCLEYCNNIIIIISLENCLTCKIHCNNNFTSEKCKSKPK